MSINSNINSLSSSNQTILSQSRQQLKEVETQIRDQDNKTHKMVLKSMRNWVMELSPYILAAAGGGLVLGGVYGALAFAPRLPKYSKMSVSVISSLAYAVFCGVSANFFLSPFSESKFSETRSKFIDINSIEGEEFLSDLLKNLENDSMYSELVKDLKNLLFNDQDYLDFWKKRLKNSGCFGMANCLAESFISGNDMLSTILQLNKKNIYKYQIIHIMNGLLKTKGVDNVSKEIIKMIEGINKLSLEEDISLRREKIKKSKEKILKLKGEMFLLNKLIKENKYQNLRFPTDSFKEIGESLSMDQANVVRETSKTLSRCFVDQDQIVGRISFRGMPRGHTFSFVFDRKRQEYYISDTERFNGVVSLPSKNHLIEAIEKQITGYKKEGKYGSFRILINL